MARPRRESLGRVRGRPRPRPACGDDPMLWKERTVAADRPAQLGLWIALLVFGTWTLFYHESFAYRYRQALDEFVVFGYGSGPGTGSYGDVWEKRQDFLEKLTAYSVVFYVAALVAVAVESASRRDGGARGGDLGRGAGHST